MRARGLVDVLIPRGGASLIRTVVEESTVPVIETGVGNCHVYVDAAADLDEGARHRAQLQDPAPVHLQHRRVAAGARGRRGGVPAARCSPRSPPPGSPCTATTGSGRYSADGRAGTDDDCGTEYLSADISAAVVDSLDDAVEHIRRYGTEHTEAIVTESVSRGPASSSPGSTRRR